MLRGKKHHPEHPPGPRIFIIREKTPRSFRQKYLPAHSFWPATALCSVVRDIAERKRTELELSRYRDSLEDLVRERAGQLEQSNEKLRFEIMERKRMEEALRESKAYLSATIESIPFQFWVIGQDGRFIMQNRISRESYGDIVGKRPEDVSPNGSTLSVWKDNNRRAFSGELVKEEVRYFFGDEERYSLAS